MCFWDSLTAAVRVVPAADGVAFEAVATFVLAAALALAAPRAGVEPAAVAFAPPGVPAAGAGATVPLALAGGPLGAGGGVSGA